MDWSTWSNSVEPVLRVGGGALLAGFIGLEREVSNKPAGFRTHMLTGGAAALLVALGPYLVKEFISEGIATEMVQADPLRIVQAIIIGVSFIGAGTILKVPDEHRIQYLTTAASVLISSGVGIAVAVGEVALAVSVVVLVLLVNYVLIHVERWFGRSSDS